MGVIINENEKIIKVTRQHWSAIWPAVIGWVVCIAIFASVRQYLLFDFFGYWNYIALALPAVAILGVWYRFIIWRGNSLILTDSRVIRTERRGLLQQSAVELLYQDIVAVEQVTRGLGGALFGFGTLILKTSANTTLEVKKLAQVSKVAQVLNSLRA